MNPQISLQLLVRMILSLTNQTLELNTSEVTAKMKTLQTRLNAEMLRQQSVIAQFLRPKWRVEPSERGRLETGMR